VTASAEHVQQLLERASQRDDEALEALVELVQRGDEAAQAAFWPWLARKLRDSVRRWTRLDEDALDDYVWGSIELIVGSIGKYRRQPGSSFLGWALVVSRRHVLRLMQRDRSGTLLRLDQHEQAVEAALQGGRPVDRRPEEVASSVTEVLEALEPRQREAVLLTYVLGYSASEVARIMRISVGTVRSHLDQAKKMARGAFGSP
jgi:RNA polymerase sigma factor (sigma-70 family)